MGLTTTLRVKAQAASLLELKAASGNACGLRVLRSRRYQVCVPRLRYANEEVQARTRMEVDVNGIFAENGTLVTDDMIASWEDSLERDKWPDGWVNVGEIVEGKLPASHPDAVTLSIKIPAPMKRVIELEAKREGRTTSAYVRGLLVDFQP